MATQSREKPNIPMCLACVLLCLTLFSVHLCSGLYARYTEKGASNDSARVASFDVSESGAYFAEDLQIATVPGVIEEQIVVVNNSEVAVSYTVVIKNLTNNIPYEFSVNGSTPKAGYCSEVCYLEPNSTDTVFLTASWGKTNALSYMGMTDRVELTVFAAQVD